MIFSGLYIAASLFNVALAANDWKKPCFSGFCAYGKVFCFSYIFNTPSSQWVRSDLPASAGSASGTLEIVSLILIFSQLNQQTNRNECSGVLRQQLATLHPLVAGKLLTALQRP